MNRTVYPALTCVLAMLLPMGCKSSEFSGDSKRAPAAKVAPKKTDDDAIPSKPTPSKETDDPSKVGEDPGVDQPKNDDKPNIGTDTDQSVIPSILDIIAGLKKILIPEDTINDENRIVFGNAKGFHIGDDNFNRNSNCADRLKTHNINGTKYFFEFEVKKDDTKIDITIHEVCGVDYTDTNFAMIEDSSSTQIQKKSITSNAAIRYDAVVLKAGKYRMVVESTPNTANNNDRDDFMVKKLEIKSDQPIVAGRVGAQ